MERRKPWRSLVFWVILLQVADLLKKEMKITDGRLIWLTYYDNVNMIYSLLLQAFHLTLNMISPETHKAVSEVIESCRMP